MTAPEKYAYLIKVDGGVNSNKFYEMKLVGDRLHVRFGRVGGGEQSHVYSASRWDSIYNQKTSSRKGYMDVTDYRAAKSVGDLRIESQYPEVSRVLEYLYWYSGEAISSRYTVGSSAVTQAQVDDAQGVLDDLTTASDPDTLNELLQKFYVIIPRKMDNVRDYLFEPLGTVPVTNASWWLSKQQDTLDVMAQRVQQNVDVGDDAGVNLLDALGIQARTATAPETLRIRRMMGDDADRIGHVIFVENTDSEQRLRGHVEPKVGQHKDTELFFHGSRNENWLSIVKKGLLIRPSGVYITGNMFGQGIYFADRARKSIGYTSIRGSHWARGNDQRGFVGVFEVNTGVPKVIQRHDSSCYKLNASRLGVAYDSVKGSRGYDLINNEYIVYYPDQVSIRYLVEIV